VSKPIGVVRSAIKEVADDCWGGVVATVALNALLFGPESTQACDRFPHVVVIFLLNKFRRRAWKKARDIRADAAIGRK